MKILFSLLFIVFSFTAIAFDKAYPLNNLEEKGFNNLDIRQIRYEANGVLVSRPSNIDERIKDIITLNGLKSLDDYALWLQKNVSYRRDSGSDQWSEPNNTLARKFGDCEDLASLNQAVLRVLGYESRILALFRLFNSHAICVFAKDGNYFIFDNTTLRRALVKTFKELASYIFSKYDCASIAEVNFRENDWTTLFKRKDLLDKKHFSRK